MNQICQECGADVTMEVSWNHWGVESLYFECSECGRSGRCKLEPDLSQFRDTSEEQSKQVYTGEKGQK
ncbi:ORF11 [Halogeometricum pleomorphic virus 1]|uniref:ORF11 n=1 Tax=Halogeometricum pleomorphic virus 1 TaxID=1156722 RepID=H9ABR2_9VIRU|nr:ORF11 [Halogeometricum pleomorphic virus 1]AFD04032.1 ORF11 [Halogeometricum pleomorphic virus 1]